jgi:Zn-finger nucleic acid-binding protein
MECPNCKISSMRRVMAGDREIDRCIACGALWFDYGEIRELTEGRLAADAGEETPHDPPGGELRRMHRQAASLSCPQCGGRVGAIDFQMTGIPVFYCRDCNGYLAPRRSAAGISARFRSFRENAEVYARLGETLAGEMRRRGSGSTVLPCALRVCRSPFPSWFRWRTPAPKSGRSPS